LKDSSGVGVYNAEAFLTSLQMQEGQIDFTFAAEQTVHAVVHVHTTSTRGSQYDNPIIEYFYGNRSPRQREVQGYGSGVIISNDGYIITNNHVIEDAQAIEVTLNDNRTFEAELTGRDPSSDIALLKIKAKNLPFIRHGDSEQLKLGEWVLAVGNPFNLTSSVTAGIVSAKGRNLGLNIDDYRIESFIYRIESFIQTDAALNMGNSGGALVNTKGLLIGITSAIISPSGAYSGNSFAIPVSIVKKVVDDLKEFGEVQRALIGINIIDVNSEIAKEQNLSEIRGILVTNIVPNGSAEEAGMKENDVIIKFDGITVNTVPELQEQVGKHRPGDKATVTYIRNNKENSVPIILKNMIGNTDIVTADIGVEVVFGAKVESLSSSDKRSLRVDSGIKVLEVDDGKFKNLGLRKGYIILSVNGRKVNSPADIRQITDNESNLESIRGIQSNGTRFSYEFGY